MRKIILCVLLFATYIFAQNCHPLSNEKKSYIKDEAWERTHDIVLVQDGVVCDNGMFYNVYFPAQRRLRSACFYENWQLYEQTTIFNYNGKHEIVFSKYDEFGMLISHTEIVKTSRTCEDLYKQFKKEMK